MTPKQLSYFGPFREVGQGLDIVVGTITMKDVAERAGVSATTVSHVINKTRFVSEEVKTRVLRAMAELNYRPNAIARSLRQKTTHTIGLVISDISNPFFTNLVRGVEDVANKKGYNLVLCNTDERPEKERTYIHVLRQKQIDGLVMAPTGGNQDFISALVEEGFPLVFVDRYLDGIGVPVVAVDNREGAYRAVKHLIDLGHERIAMITGLPSITSTAERFEGYKRALAEHGLVADSGLTRQGNSRVDGGYSAAIGLLEMCPRPTAVFVANNLMTIGVMRALQDKGVRCPEDVAIVGFDDFEWASAFRPFLTTVAQPVYELGKTAAEMLVKRIGKKRPRMEKVVLKSSLIIRESCGVLLRRG